MSLWHCVVAYLLAIASAALYGAADFLGGIGSRRASTIAIVVTSQGCGLLALLLILPFLPAASPSTRDLVWGATAGVAGGVGVALLYRALAVGRMAVVAPTTAVCAVIIPVVAGVLTGDRLAPLTTIGIGTRVGGDPARESADDRIQWRGNHIRVVSTRASGSRLLQVSRLGCFTWRSHDPARWRACGRSSEREPPRSASSAFWPCGTHSRFA